MGLSTDAFLVFGIPYNGMLDNDELTELIQKDAVNQNYANENDILIEHKHQDIFLQEHCCISETFFIFCIPEYGKRGPNVLSPKGFEASRGEVVNINPSDLNNITQEEVDNLWKAIQRIGIEKENCSDPGWHLCVWAEF